MAFDLPIFLSREERGAVSDPKALIHSTPAASPPSSKSMAAATLNTYGRAPAPLPAVSAPRSILERTRPSTVQSVSVSRVHSLVDSGFHAATTPSNLAIILGGQILFRSLCESRVVLRTAMAEQAAMAAPAVETGRTAFRLGALGLPLAAVGCNASYHWDTGGGSGGDGGMSSDGTVEGVGTDEDGDGYRVSVDCNDSNSSIHPLPASGGEVVIENSRTICPGTYHNVRIVIRPGTTGITLSGYSVILDGDNSLQSAIRMEQVSRSQIEGFTFRNYDSGSGVVSLLGSNNNTLRGMTAEVGDGTWALHLSDSDNNTIEGWTVRTHADRGIQVESSNQATLRGNDLMRVPPYDGLAWYGLVMLDGGTGHRVENNTLDSGLNFGMALYNLTDSTVINNDIFTNDADGIMFSSVRLSRIENNSVNNNAGYALNLKNSSTQNQILNNDFTLNDLGSVLADTSSSSGNIFSGNTPAP